MAFVDPFRRGVGFLRADGSLVRAQLTILGVLTALSWIGVAMTPLLIHHPIILVGFAPRLLFLTIAAAVTSLPLFLLVGTLRLCVADPVNFSIGRVLGPRVQSRFSGKRRLPSWLTSRLERTGIARKYAMGALLFLRPNGITMNIAGANGVSGKMASLLALAGTVTYLFLLHAGAGFVTG
ncbi:MAG: hypothetical protein V3V01_06615 [Acidimicrobiales bacterium]